MSYWKNKVLPKIKKLVGSKGKKIGAEDVIAAFQSSMERWSKEMDDKKEELKPKVVTIYQSSSNETKTLLKTPTKPNVEEYSQACQSLLVELCTAGVPRAQHLSDGATKHGITPLSAQILLFLEKLKIFVEGEEAPLIEPKSEIEPISESKEEAKALEELPPKHIENKTDIVDSTLESKQEVKALEEPTHQPKEEVKVPEEAKPQPKEEIKAPEAPTPQSKEEVKAPEAPTPPPKEQLKAP